jgi:glycosyltransferase involved in cell wall biosynthesis
MDAVWGGAAPSVRERRRSVCLCMIVRDEADRIETALRSCRELIDYWVICDTGSTDDTRSLILHELEGIPGELHEDMWIDFGDNRNRLMARARGRSEYLLLLDADETVELTAGGLDDLALDAYTVARVAEHRERVKRVVRGALPWHYVGGVCEYLESPLERTSGHLDGLVIRSGPPGERQHRRWQSDRGLLEAAVRADPTDARSIFYLARTLHALAAHTGDGELLKAALEAYERRTGMSGSEEEAYYSLFQAGAIYEALDDWPSACERYLSAWQLRPRRLESVFATAAGLLSQQLPRAAARFTALAETTLAVPDDTLLVSPWVYEWGLLMLHSAATLGCGDLDASLAASRRLLALGSLPEDRRAAAQHHVSLALREKVNLAVGATATDMRPAP